MSYREVTAGGRMVAAINRQHPAADGYRADVPWLLLHNDGKTRSFPSFAEAREEARKVYPGATVKRGAA